MRGKIGREWGVHLSTASLHSLALKCDVPSRVCGEGGGACNRENILTRDICEREVEREGRRRRGIGLVKLRACSMHTNMYDTY